MKRLLLLAALLACSDSSAPKIDPNAYVGTWTVDIPAVTNCWPAFSLAFAIPQESATEFFSQNVMNIVGTWWFPSTPTNTSPTTGSMNWDTPHFALVFTRGAKRGRIEGSELSTTRLTGTFTDTDGAFKTGLNCPDGASVPATATK